MDVPGWVRAALAAGILSGIPSTLHAVATGQDPLEATRAAGTILRPAGGSDGALLVSGAVAHFLLTVAWTRLLTPVLRRSRRPVPLGAALGLAVAALDLSIGQRWLPQIAALPSAPQVADHVAFGALLGAVVRASTAEANAGQ